MPGIPLDQGERKVLIPQTVCVLWCEREKGERGREERETERQRDRDRETERQRS